MAFCCRSNADVCPSEDEVVIGQSPGPRADTVTRQMGIVDGYAAAIITDAVGPAIRQSDGDSAHVRQMNRLARLLEQRLAYEQARR